jgi:hypothetical protein
MILLNGLNFFLINTANKLEIAIRNVRNWRQSQRMEPTESEEVEQLERRKIGGRGMRTAVAVPNTVNIKRQQKPVSKIIRRC